MAIWHRELTLDALNQRGAKTMVEWLDIQFIEIGESYLVATMPVAEKTRQPIGILHGGASVVLAETIASTAANQVVDIDNFYCVGLEINANHIRPVKEGLVTGKASPIHLGRTTQVWQIKLKNEEGKTTCISRMTASVIKRKQKD